MVRGSKQTGEIHSAGPERSNRFHRIGAIAVPNQGSRYSPLALSRGWLDLIPHGRAPGRRNAGGTTGAPSSCGRGVFFIQFSRQLWRCTMLDINIIREQPDVVRKALVDRQDSPEPVDQILELDRQRRQTIQEAEGLKAERNTVSKEIGKAKDSTERQSKIEAMRSVGERISQLDETLRQIEEHLNAILAGIPNLPDARTPYGKDESENVVLRGVGDIPEFNFQLKPHWDLGPSLGIIDFEQGVKITGSAFCVVS